MAGVVMSERIALVGLSVINTDTDVDVTYIANWTLPSLSPPMTRESKYDANVVLFIHLCEQKGQCSSTHFNDFVYAHKGGEYIANHSDQKNFFASIFVGE